MDIEMEQQMKSKRKLMIVAVVIGCVIVYHLNNIGVFGLKNQKITPLKVKNKLCNMSYADQRPYIINDPNLEMIYFITPTYPRPEQVPELTRLSHTLMHVPRIHWIIADDQPLCSEQVRSIAKRSGLPYTHISSPRPFSYSSPDFPRGVANRRAALTWVWKHVQHGVIYFGDDDNTMDLQLFDEIRRTQKVSMFPVGLIGGYGVSTPIVIDGKVVAFFDSWPAGRMFPVDMAGFAVNIKFLKPSMYMPFSAGYEEDRFLLSLDLKVEEIEPLAANCSQILVWHTRTAKYKKPTLKINVHTLQNDPEFYYFIRLLNETARFGMAVVLSDDGTKPYVTRNRKSTIMNALLK